MNISWISFSTMSQCSQNISKMFKYFGPLFLMQYHESGMQKGVMDSCVSLH